MHDFFHKLARILNTGMSRSVLLTGNVYDLFYDSENWSPLVDFLSKKCKIKANGQQRGVIQVIYEINRPVRADNDELAKAWNIFKRDNSFDVLCQQTAENPTFALEFLRQLTVCARDRGLDHDLLIIIEGAEMLLPAGNYASLQFADRKRISIMLDWFGDPKFMNGYDSVVLLAESRSLLHPIVANLPQILNVVVPSPNKEERLAFSQRDLFCDLTAGLSILAYRQLLCDEGNLTQKIVLDKVEEFICGQLGEGVVEFKRPTHALDDVIGFSQLKEFLRKDLIPRFKAGSLSGVAVAGPIGGGKSFIFEAMASELGMPVLVLKNLRSQWFGQTDVIFERLKRTLEAFDKVCIFVDEADTQFGNLSSDSHETERRLTGKVQAMMSDPKFKGKVIWLLMTARIEKLSADIRRPGRAGDLIIPVLDPEGEDRKEFLKWVANACSDYKDIENPIKDFFMVELDKLTIGYSAASFSSLRSQAAGKTRQEAIEVAGDLMPADIKGVRRQQELQALLNCTRKCLIPKSYLIEDVEQMKSAWREELLKLG